MKTVLDHIVIACAGLAQGSAWLREKLGVEPEEGGKHATMGTHNRLLRLGARQYLELLAVDPDADPPDHPRWFGLDERGIRERAAREPFLLTWVAATDDLDEATARVPELGAAQELSRGALRWRIALPEGGVLPFDGVLPAVIQWVEGHPCDRLEDRGCEILSLEWRHPSASDIAMTLQVLEFEAWDAVEAGPKRFAAGIRCPRGEIIVTD
ncbi:MAG TPA: VOC family protein [Candidatus Eisenbacteria bacterium]|nr:VOC family protein [Candidatus Eisenbacteria bacterium]